MNLDDLLERAKWGSVEDHELHAVVDALKDSSSRYDRYTLIHILGRGGSPEDYEDIIRPFLDFPDDPMVSRIALQALCAYWGRTAAYLPEIERFIRGVDWDTSSEVRQIAISQAGEYLRENRYVGLVELLLTIFSDDSEEKSDREDAYFALARAMGKEWSELPSATVDLDFNTDVNIDVLNWARRIISVTSPD